MIKFKEWLNLQEITQQEIVTFDTTMQNPLERKWVKSKLLEMGWPPDFCDYQEKDEGMNMPFSDLRNVILHIDQYENPIVTKIDPQVVPLPQDISDEHSKNYNSYISGDTNLYFRVNSSNPRNINWNNIPPITLLQDGGQIEIADGMHRVFLAKKQSVPSIKAWIIKKSKNNHPAAKQILDFFRTKLN